MVQKEIKKPVPKQTSGEMSAYRDNAEKNHHEKTLYKDVNRKKEEIKNCTIGGF